MDHNADNQKRPLKQNELLLLLELRKHYNENRPAFVRLKDSLVEYFPGEHEPEFRPQWITQQHVLDSMKRKHSLTAEECMNSLNILVEVFRFVDEVVFSGHDPLYDKSLPAWSLDRNGVFRVLDDNGRVLKAMKATSPFFKHTHLRYRINQAGLKACYDFVDLDLPDKAADIHSRDTTSPPVDTTDSKRRSKKKVDARETEKKSGKKADAKRITRKKIKRIWLWDSDCKKMRTAWFAECRRLKKKSPRRQFIEAELEADRARHNNYRAKRRYPRTNSAETMYRQFSENRPEWKPQLTEVIRKAREADKKATRNRQK